MQLHIVVVLLRSRDAFIVVVYRHSQILFGLVLSDDVFVEDAHHFVRLWQLFQLYAGSVGIILLDDLPTQLYALITDEYAGACHQAAHLLLRFTAKRADRAVDAFVVCHLTPPFPLPWRR